MTVDQDSAVGFDPARPFLRASAVAHGLAKNLRTPAYKRLLHGIYVSASVEVTPTLIAEAALLSFGEKAWASHATAARVLDLPIPALPGEHVTVVERQRRRGRKDITCHLTKKGWVQAVNGVRVSAPKQVFVAKDIYKSPGRTLERIHRALLLRGEPGVPKSLSDAWQAHFPGWS